MVAVVDHRARRGQRPAVPSPRPAGSSKRSVPQWIWRPAGSGRTPRSTGSTGPRGGRSRSARSSPSSWGRRSTRPGAPTETSTPRWPAPCARWATTPTSRPVGRLVPVCGSSVRLVVRPVPGWRRVELDGRTLRVPAGVSLDLGAIAKAWAADRSAALVADRLGVDVLVSLGGDIATAGAPGRVWPVLVSDGPGQPESRVTIPGRAGLATSSTISRTWRRGGQSMHHVLDPRTSMPAPTVWRTVTVAASTCVEANTLTTAGIVRGTTLPWPGCVISRSRPAWSRPPGRSSASAAGRRSEQHELRALVRRPRLGRRRACCC